MPLALEGDPRSLLSWSLFVYKILDVFFAHCELEDIKHQGKLLSVWSSEYRYIVKGGTRPPHGNTVDNGRDAERG